MSLRSRRLLPSRYACHLPPGGRLFVSLIITQIGRGNNPSAEIYVPVISPLIMQRKSSAIFLFCKLTVIKLVIEAAALKEGSVITLLDDVAVLHNEYNISLAYG